MVLKQALLDHVWPDQVVGDAALQSYIMDIRKAIGDGGNGQRLLRTIRGRGYRLIAPVEVQDPVVRKTSNRVGSARIFILISGVESHCLNHPRYIPSSLESERNTARTHRRTACAISTAFWASANVGSSPG
jgi:hypothetical protein